MKRAFLILCGVVSMMTWLISTGTADNGPHGNYSATTDACAACHRAHTAQGASLLTTASTSSDRSSFCYSCHSGGTGAYTDVKNGLFITTATIITATENTSIPTSNLPLKGGGFEQVKMNATLTGSATLAVTSNHAIDGSSGTVWGHGAVTSTVYAGPTGVSLTCTNCHNPHGKAGADNTATYRILKGNNSGNTPLFATSTITVTANYDIPDDTWPREYNIDIVGENYFGQHSGEGSSGPTQKYAALTKWCAQCHTRYQEPMSSEPAHNNSGDAHYKFRHGTNNVNNPTSCLSCHWGEWFWPPAPGCITCHMAHGTGAKMGTYSGAVPWPDGAASPNGNARSALLRLDNRGVCEQCHNK